MSHYSAVKWVDFARGCLPPAEVQQVNASLAAGCAECASALKLWSEVQETMVRENEYEPSAAAVQAVKDAFPEEKPVEWMRSAIHLATILFDSFLQPALAGVRSSSKNSRQLTVESGPFVVDLQLESEAAQRQVLLTGQILASGSSQEKIGGAEIILLNPEKILKKTKANESGEFYLDFAREEHLRLFIDIKGERAVGIILPDMQSAQTERTQ